MNKILRLLALSAAVFAIQPSAATTTYVVGVEDLSYLPHYTVEAGEYRGYAREVLDAFAASQGIRFEYQPLPVTRLFRMLVDGQIDFKYPDSPYWNKAIKEGVGVAYSEPVAPYVDGVMVRPDNFGRGPEELRKLGTVRGFTPWAWMDRVKDDKVSLRENPSFSGLLRQVIAGRVDGAYLNEAVARHFLHKRMNQPDALVFDPALPHVRDNYFMSTTKHGALIDAFNRWLEDRATFVATKQQEWGIVEKQP